MIEAVRNFATRSVSVSVTDLHHVRDSISLSSDSFIAVEHSVAADIVPAPPANAHKCDAVPPVSRPPLS
jgi:hypothetical protein